MFLECDCAMGFIDAMRLRIRCELLKSYGREVSAIPTYSVSLAYGHEARRTPDAWSYRLHLNLFPTM